jgi:hypothetical protein
VDPDGKDYWSTNDPGEIQRFISSIETSRNAFEYFNFSSWDHARDADFTGNLTFNDKTNTFYSSYNTIENGELVVHGVSIKAQSVGKENATVQTWYGKWLERSSGRAENVYPEFAVIMGGTKAGWAFARWLYNQVSSPVISTTNTFNANANFKGGSQKTRDASIKEYSTDFQRWYHRYYKGNSRIDASKEELKELYKEWIKMGQPKVK